MLNMKPSTSVWPLETSLGVGVGEDVAVVQASADRWDDCNVSIGCQRLMSIQRVGAVEILVDDSNHTAFAMGTNCLGAVVPDGRLVLDHDLEDIRSLALGGGLKATEEGILLWHAGGGK